MWCRISLYLQLLWLSRILLLLLIPNLHQIWVNFTYYLLGRLDEVLLLELHLLELFIRLYTVFLYFGEIGFYTIDNLLWAFHKGSCCCWFNFLKSLWMAEFFLGFLGFGVGVFEFFHNVFDIFVCEFTGVGWYVLGHTSFSGLISLCRCNDYWIVDIENINSDVVGLLIKVRVFVFGWWFFLFFIF
jgi:hypothetical protein